MPDYSTYGDRELAELLTLDDETAFTEIYNRYWDRMYGLSLVKLKSSESAEDVVQEVFSDLWRRRSQVKIENLSAYLGTAIKYSILRKIARLGKDRLYLVNKGDSYNKYEQSLVELRFLREMMDREINRLPEKCRIVFHYSREQQLSNKEIAQKLSISQKAVEKHISVALRKLKLSLRRSFLNFFCL